MKKREGVGQMPMRMKIHTGYICLSLMHFSLCFFLIACMRWGKLTLVPFVSLFSSDVGYQMCSQSAAHGNANLHWLHLYGFSPVCVLTCARKLSVPVGAYLHWIHLYDFSLWGTTFIKEKKNHSKRALPIKLIPDTCHRHCHVEKFFHLTDCLVEKFSTWQIVMWISFTTW